MTVHPSKRKYFTNAAWTSSNCQMRHGTLTMTHFLMLDVHESLLTKQQMKIKRTMSTRAGNIRLCSIQAWKTMTNPFKKGTSESDCSFFVNKDNKILYIHIDVQPLRYFKKIYRYTVQFKKFRSFSHNTPMYSLRLGPTYTNLMHSSFTSDLPHSIYLEQLYEHFTNHYQKYSLVLHTGFITKSDAQSSQAFQPFNNCKLLNSL